MDNSSEQPVLRCCRLVGGNTNLLFWVRAQGLPCLDAKGWDKAQVSVSVTSISSLFLEGRPRGIFTQQTSKFECSSSSGDLSPFEGFSSALACMNDCEVGPAWGRGAVWELQCPLRCCSYTSERLALLWTYLLFLCPAASQIVLQLVSLFMAPGWK